MKSIENIINSSTNRLIELTQDIYGLQTPRRSLAIGKASHSSFINIERGNIIIDGKASTIDVKINTDFQGELSLIRLAKNIKNVTLTNLKIKVHFVGEHSNNKFYCIYNCSEELKIENCSIEVISDSQINLYGIYNYGDKSETWNANADTVSICNNRIYVDCRATTFPNTCHLYGIYNTVGGSLSVVNNYINVNNDGNGDKQVAIGIYTDGMYGRFIGNNIKAQTPHIRGVSREKAYTVGFKNAGQYSLISDNNIVSERGGSSIGLDNAALQVKITGNKILSTHTIWGITVRNSGAQAIISSNLILSTAKNGRLLEQTTHSSIITSNLIRTSVIPPLAITNCGIYAPSKDAHHNIIADNIIKDVLNCGIYCNILDNTISNNEILSDNDSITKISEPNLKFNTLFDENSVKSIE